MILITALAGIGCASTASTSSSSTAPTNSSTGADTSTIGTLSTGTGTGSGSGTSSAGGGTQSAVGPGCDGITVNAVTSCAFAKNVKRAYDAGPSTAVQAFSPVTGKSYTMTCSQSSGTVTCTGAIGARLSFSGSSPATGGTGTGASPVEGPGSSSHATDAEFCSTHTCIENFPNGAGTIVQCADSQWSHSGGLSGACSDHGGER